jgi:Family of unknown function (DUF1028)
MRNIRLVTGTDGPVGSVYPVSTGLVVSALARPESASGRGRGRLAEHHRPPAGRPAAGQARSRCGRARSEQRDLAARLLDGLRGALAAGGEAGPVHSAGLAVTHPTAGWAETDLRVDWHDTDPIGELDRLWQRWRPLRGDYVTRGLNPTAAPGYGVPGE